MNRLFKLFKKKQVEIIEEQKEVVYNYLEHELSNLEDSEVNMLFNNGAESREVNGQEILKLELMPYWFVKVELNDHFSKFELTTILEKALKYSKIKAEVHSIPLNVQMKLICYLLNTLKKIVNMESVWFKSSSSEMDAIAAGSNNFNKFEEYNSLNALSTDVLKWDKLKKLPYETCFTKLLMNKTQADFDKKFAENARNKNKKK